MTAKIRFDRVSKTFAGQPQPGTRTAAPRFVALEDISFSVAPGEFVTLVGPSGCGKSTLIDLLGGLTLPSSGKILLDGRAITGPALDRGVVFQQYALFPWRTALANVEFGLEAQGVPARERRDIARAHLELVGLGAFAERYPHELSGGMKQRVAIARSLAYNPDVLLMDEPFAALDAQTREDLQGELLRIWQKTGKTILFITHGIDEAVVLGQRVLVMSARPGRILETIEVPPALHGGDEDVRSLALFGEVRHQVWSLLRDEVRKAQAASSGARATPSSSTAGAAAATLAH